MSLYSNSGCAKRSLASTFSRRLFGRVLSTGNSKIRQACRRFFASMGQVCSGKLRLGVAGPGSDRFGWSGAFESICFSANWVLHFV